MSKTFIIGDIHGCYYTLETVLDKIEKLICPEDTLVFLGDYFDRGFHNYKVYQKLMDLEEKEYKVVFLKGNHEELFYEAYEDEDYYLWFANGGRKTCEEISADELVKLYLWIMELPYAYKDEENNIYCVHAYLPHTFIEDFDDEEKDSCLWNRARYSSVGAKVFHGHTAHVGTVVTHINDINIDTGCVFGGGLTFAIVSDKGSTITYTTVPTEGRDLGKFI